MSSAVFRKVVTNVRRLTRNYNGIRCFGATKQLENKNKFVLSGVEDIELPRKTVPEYIFEKIGDFGEYVAFECPLTKRSYTYDDLRIKSRNLSKALKVKLKLQKGDVVATYLGNIPEFPITVLGCLEAGLVVSTINSLYTPDEIARQLINSNSVLVITTCGMHNTVVKALEKIQKKLPIICIKTEAGQLLPQGAISFAELTDNTIDIPDIEQGSPDDLAVLPYSSGTTGLPKGVELTHFNIVANLEQMLHPSLHIADLPTKDFQTVVPGVLPMYHIYGFTVTVLEMMIRGAKVLTMPKFTPDLYVEMLKNYPVSVIFAAPPLILFLTDHPNVKADYLKPLRSLLSGAAPLGGLDEERFLQKVNNPDLFFSQGYGLTETSPVVSSTIRSVRSKLREESKGSVGVPISNTLIKIINIDDPSGTPLGPNQLGELLVKGPQVMKGYHKNPEATDNAFLGDWFRTGDMAYYTEHNLLFITERLKELIKVKGFQVAPAELEEIIRDFPSVLDAAVIGVPHKEYGEVPRAYVVPRSQDAGISIGDLHKYVNEKVAKYKQLSGGVEIIDAVPKNNAGKILRRELRQKYEGESSKKLSKSVPN